MDVTLQRFRVSLVALVLGLSLLLPSHAFAQNKDIETLKKEIEELKAAIEQGSTQDEQLIQALLSLVERIEALEAKSGEVDERLNQVGQGAGVDAEELETLKERLEELETDSADNFETIFGEFARRVALSGYTTFGFLVPEPKNFPQESRPFFHSFGLNLLLNSQITEELRFFAELQQQEVSRFGEGDTGSAITIRRSFMEFLFNDYIGVRFGIILVPFGWFNKNPEDWRYAFDTRPLVNEVVFPSVYNDVGIELFGFIYRGEEVQLDYDIAVVNGLNDGIGVAADLGAGGAFDLPQFGGQAGSPRLQPGLRGARPGENVDNNVNKAVSLRLGLNLFDIFGLGVSGYAGRYDSDEENPDFDTVKPEDDFWMGMIGADFRVAYEGLLVRGEFTHVFIEEFPDLITEDLDGDPNTLGDLTSFKYPEFITGFSVDIEYHFWFDALNDTFLKIGSNPSFFGAIRFDYANTATEQLLLGFEDTTPLSEIMLSFAIGYRPYHRAAIRLEWIQGGLDWMGVTGFSDLVLTNTWLFAFSVSLGF